MTPRKNQGRPLSSEHRDAPVNLADLIRREQDHTGASYSEIAKATGLSKAKIGQIADPTATYQVRPETMEKLARGLRLPLAVVKRAALATAGVSVPETGRTGRTEILLHQLGQLDDDTLSLIEAMVDAAVRHRNG